MYTNFNAGGIPQELKNINAWLCWKKEKHGERMSKIPVNPHNGLLANATSKNDCTTLKQALEACNDYHLDGVGFAFYKDNNFVGVDIDHCLDGKGKPNPFARKIIDELDSYTEISPSGNGIHIICKSAKDPKGKHRNTELGLEIYSDKRYFTFTGNSFENRIKISECTEALEKITQKYMNNTSSQDGDFQANYSLNNIPSILTKAFSSRNGGKMRDLYEGRWQTYYNSQSEADIAFCNMLAFWTGKNADLMNQIFQTSKLYRPKWNARRNDKTYGLETICNAIKSCSNTYTASSRRASMNKNVIVQPVKSNSELPKWYIKKGDNITFMAGVLAKTIADEGNIIYADSYFYQYINGVYKITSANQISKLIQGNLLDEYAKTSQVKDTLEQLKNKVLIDSENLNNYPLVMNLNNGIFDASSKDFKPHDKKYLSTIQLNCGYQENAECPKFMEFIKNSVSEECIPLIQEITGYVLVPLTNAQKAFVLYGPPRTGKSTYLRMLESIIGKDNISNISWQDLGSRFKTAFLFGKTLNIFADLPNTPIEEAGIFKALIGEDTLTAERKFADPFSFTNKARLMFSCNELPRNLADRTDAFYRRLIILPFLNQVSSSKLDTRLTEKLATEKEGILNWALIGLERLIKNDFRFSETETTEKMISEYKLDNDTVLWFLNQYCEIVQGAIIGTSQIYDAYKQACQENGLKAVSNIRFIKTLSTYLGDKIENFKDVKTRRSMYRGICMLKSI